MTMELSLSTDVLEGLQLIADNAHIPDGSFSDFVVSVCESLYDGSKRDAVLGGYPTIAQSVPTGVRPQLRIALVAMLTFCLIIRKRDHQKFLKLSTATAIISLIY